MRAKLLNIGCGKTFHNDWINIDIVAFSPEVIEHNILNGLPFEDDYFDAVYSSHVLEHLEKNDALEVLKDTFRVLKNGGILRVVVPDLETIARLYLEKLEKADQGDKSALHDYEWMKLELIDQMARSSPGGMMLHYLTNKSIDNKDFVRQRIGMEAEQFWSPVSSPGNQPRKKIFNVPAMRLKLAMIVVKVIAGKRGLQAFEEGLFRNSGEIHRWMYDKFSLKMLMEEAGYRQVRVCSAFDSGIQGFNNFNLDVINGEILKPDSLYMEGVKCVSSRKNGKTD